MGLTSPWQNWERKQAPHLSALLVCEFRRAVPAPQGPVVFMPCGVWGEKGALLSQVLPVSSHNSTLAHGPELPSGSAFPTLSLLCGAGRHRCPMDWSSGQMLLYFCPGPTGHQLPVGSLVAFSETPPFSILEGSQALPVSIPHGEQQEHSCRPSGTTSSERSASVCTGPCQGGSDG